MKCIISALIFVSSVCAYAQTPFDAFSPETSRIILDADSIAAWRAAQRRDTILCAIVADLHNEQLLLVDLRTRSVLAHAPMTEDTKNWLSVDPLSDKYPSTSGYMYCNGNPVMLVDPDGRYVVDPTTDQILQEVRESITIGRDSWQFQLEQDRNLSTREKRKIKRCINEANRTLDDIQKMYTDPSFEFQIIGKEQTEPATTLQGLNKKFDPMIVIEIQNAQDASRIFSLVQEIRHCGQIARHEYYIGYYQTPAGLVPYIALFNLYHEVDSYSAALAITGTLSLPLGKDHQIQITRFEQLTPELILQMQEEYSPGKWGTIYSASGRPNHR